MKSDAEEGQRPTCRRCGFEINGECVFLLLRHAALLLESGVGQRYNRLMSKAARKPLVKANGIAPKENVSELGRILRRLAEKHAASGGKLLNRREIEREVAERRGAR